MSCEGITFVASRRPPSPASIDRVLHSGRGEGHERGSREQFELGDRALVAGDSVGNLRRLLGALQRLR